MNENLETETPQQSGTGMNMTMIIGGVIVLAIIGYFVVKSTATEPAKDAASTDAMIEESNTMESMPAGDAMMMQDTTTTETTMDNTTDPTVSTETMEGDTLVVKIDAGSFYYKPNQITVKKGQKVRIEMTSVDMMHDFTIDELDVSMPIVKSGDTGTVEFVADTVGEFEFYCSVGQHRANGQVGTLIVE